MILAEPRWSEGLQKSRGMDDCVLLQVHSDLLFRTVTNETRRRCDNWQVDVFTDRSCSKVRLTNDDNRLQVAQYRLHPNNCRSELQLARDQSFPDSQGGVARCSGHKSNSFSCKSFTSSPIVTRAVPRTTIQCSARWRCNCSDNRPPCLTTMRLTWNRSPISTDWYEPQGRWTFR